MTNRPFTPSFATGETADVHRRQPPLLEQGDHVMNPNLVPLCACTDPKLAPLYGFQIVIWTPTHGLSEPPPQKGNALDFDNDGSTEK